MIMIREMIHQDIIFPEREVKNQEEFFHFVSRDLYEKGYVHASFEKAITTREKKYPTGLQLDNIAIAIPHTDCEHIIQAFLCVNRIITPASSPITFMQMGTDDVKVFPEYVLVLGITQPKEQVTLLSLIMELFSQETFVQKLRCATTTSDMYSAFIEGSGK